MDLSSRSTGTDRVIDQIGGESVPGRRGYAGEILNGVERDRTSPDAPSRGASGRPDEHRSAWLSRSGRAPGVPAASPDSLTASQYRRKGGHDRESGPSGLGEP